MEYSSNGPLEPPEISNEAGEHFEMTRGRRNSEGNAVKMENQENYKNVDFVVDVPSGFEFPEGCWVSIIESCTPSPTPPNTDSDGYMDSDDSSPESGLPESPKQLLSEAMYVEKDDDGRDPEPTEDVQALYDDNEMATDSEDSSEARNSDSDYKPVASKRSSSVPASPSGRNRRRKKGRRTISEVLPPKRIRRTKAEIQRLTPKQREKDKREQNKKASSRRAQKMKENRQDIESEHVKLEALLADVHQKNRDSEAYLKGRIDEKAFEMLQNEKYQVFEWHSVKNQDELQEKEKEILELKEKFESAVKDQKKAKSESKAQKKAKSTEKSEAKNAKTGTIGSQKCRAKKKLKIAEMELEILELEAGIEAELEIKGRIQELLSTVSESPSASIPEDAQMESPPKVDLDYDDVEVELESDVFFAMETEPTYQDLPTLSDNDPDAERFKDNLYGDADDNSVRKSGSLDSPPEDALEMDLFNDEEETFSDPNEDKKAWKSYLSGNRMKGSECPDDLLYGYDTAPNHFDMSPGPFPPPDSTSRKSAVVPEPLDALPYASYAPKNQDMVSIRTNLAGTDDPANSTLDLHLKKPTGCMAQANGSDYSAPTAHTFDNSNRSTCLVTGRSYNPNRNGPACPGRRFGSPRHTSGHAVKKGYALVLYPESSEENTDQAFGPRTSDYSAMTTHSFTGSIRSNRPSTVRSHNLNQAGPTKKRRHFDDPEDTSRDTGDDPGGYSPNSAQTNGSDYPSPTAHPFDNAYHSTRSATRRSYSPSRNGHTWPGQHFGTLEHSAGDTGEDAGAYSPNSAKTNGSDYSAPTAHPFDNSNHSTRSVTKRTKRSSSPSRNRHEWPGQHFGTLEHNAGDAEDDLGGYALGLHPENTSSTLYSPSVHPESPTDYAIMEAEIQAAGNLIGGRAPSLHPEKPPKQTHDIQSESTWSGHRPGRPRATSGDAGDDAGGYSLHLAQANGLDYLAPTARPFDISYHSTRSATRRSYSPSRNGPSWPGRHFGSPRYTPGDAVLTGYALNSHPENTPPTHYTPSVHPESSTDYSVVEAAIPAAGIQNGGRAPRIHSEKPLKHTHSHIQAESILSTWPGHRLRCPGASIGNSGRQRGGPAPNLHPENTPQNTNSDIQADSAWPGNRLRSPGATTGNSGRQPGGYAPVLQPENTPQHTHAFIQAESTWPGRLENLGDTAGDAGGHLGGYSSNVQLESSEMSYLHIEHSYCRRDRRTREELEEMTVNERKSLKRAQNRQAALVYAARKKHYFHELQKNRDELQEKLEELKEENKEIEEKILNELKDQNDPTILDDYIDSLEKRKCGLRKEVWDKRKDELTKKEQKIQWFNAEKEAIMIRKMEAAAENQPKNRTFRSQKCRNKQKLELANVEWNKASLELAVEQEEAVQKMLRELQGEKSD